MPDAFPVEDSVAGQTAMPTSTQLAEFLNVSGVGDGATVASDVATFVGAAIREFELLTGWVPFVAGASSSYYFDPAEDGLNLDFRTGFAAVTAVVVGITSDDTTGTALTLNTDYYLTPYNDTGETQAPFMGVSFMRQIRGMRRSIKVTGTKGYCSAVPDDVWQAIMARAAALAAPTVKMVGDAEKVKEGAVELTYAAGGSQESGWTKQFQQVVSRYRRVVV